MSENEDSSNTTTDTNPTTSSSNDLANEELDNFLDSLDSFTPIRTGFKTSDKRVLRLVSLSAQKYMSEVCQDSFEYCKRRQQSGASKSKDKRYVLNNEDLSNSLAEYGITVRKPEYFSDSLTIETVKRKREASGTSSSNK